MPYLPEALDLFDADAIRFFLTINAPESRDTDFSWDEFQRRNNDELVATYGNAVHRLLSFVQSRFGGVVPTPGQLTGADEAMLDLTRATFATVGDRIAAVHLREALLLVMALATALNRYLDEAAPWKTLKSDPERAASTLNTCCEWIACLARWMVPFMPGKAEALWRMLGQPGRAAAAPWPAIPTAGRWRTLHAGQPLGEVSALFTKLEDADIRAEVDDLERRSATSPR